MRISALRPRSARMNELKSRGVDSIVDLTVIGLGRYIPRIQRIAAQTKLNIIVATGIYTYSELPLLFPLPRSRHRLRRTRTDRRHVRARHRAGHRRYRRQGGHSEMRHRRTRRDARRRTNPASHRASASPHRRADFHSHPRAQAGRPGSAAHLPRRRRGSVARSHRPFRRHHGPRVSGGADRATDPISAWTASASTPSCRSKTA